VFQTKPEMALELPRTACADGVPPGVVLSDVAYGNDGGFRAGITALGLRYSVGIQSTTLFWKPDAAPPPRRGKRRYSHARIRPHQASAKQLALALPPEAWHEITWRVGSEPPRSRFARLHVSPAGRVEPPPEEWLLIEWPEGEPEPIKYWLSTLPEDTPFEDLVDLTKLRWRIERDYQELKQEFGFGQYEGRGWRGLHHHMTLCVAVYGFLIAERAAIPPSRSGGSSQPQTFAVSNRCKSGPASGANRATRRTVHSNDASAPRRGAGAPPRAMSVLYAAP